MPYIDITVGAATYDVLGAILATQAIPTVLFRGCSETDLKADGLLPLINLAQQHNAAALLADEIDLIRIVHGDGVHLSPGPFIEARYKEARAAIGRQFIIGASAGKSRHDAMVLGELEADYIAFGAPAVVQDQIKAKATRLNLIAWWAELFEVPCVAFDAESNAEIAELTCAGADFVAISIPVAISASEAIEKVNGAMKTLAQSAANKETA